MKRSRATRGTVLAPPSRFLPQMPFRDSATFPFTLTTLSLLFPPKPRPQDVLQKCLCNVYLWSSAGRSHSALQKPPTDVPIRSFVYQPACKFCCNGHAHSI